MSRDYNVLTTLRNSGSVQTFTLGKSFVLVGPLVQRFLGDAFLLLELAQQIVRLHTIKLEQYVLKLLLFLLGVDIGHQAQHVQLHRI